eukprot:1071-Heterococcus_DN1.PRE.3
MQSSMPSNGLCCHRSAVMVQGATGTSRPRASEQQHAHLEEAAKLCDCSNAAVLLTSWKLLAQLHSANAHSNAIDCCIPDR